MAPHMNSFHNTTSAAIVNFTIYFIIFTLFHLSGKGERLGLCCSHTHTQRRLHKEEGEWGAKGAAEGGRWCLTAETPLAVAARNPRGRGEGGERGGGR